MGCPDDDELLLTAGDRLHHLPGRFSVVRCRTCQLIRTSPRPTLETIGRYYPADYGPHAVNPVVQGKGGFLTRLTQTRSQAIPPLLPGRLLELGCSTGAFLAEMRSRGWQVRGVEMSKTASARARAHGLDVHTGSVESAPDPDSPYDLVAAWMVLEHLHNPRLALAKSRDWTTVDGWLVLSVPDAATFELRLFGDAWYALQVPTHLHHFTPRTLERMLAAEGWTLRRVIHQRSLDNVIASLGYRIADRRADSSIARRLITFPETGGRWKYPLLPLAAAAAALGQTGRITVWAQKRA
jgi:SAM-dependent methyltransferase